MASRTKALWLWLWGWEWAVEDASPEVKSFRACIAAALPSEEEEAASGWGVGSEEEPRPKNLRWDWTASGG
jgi:hypothetical protein